MRRTSRVGNRWYGGPRLWAHAAALLILIGCVAASDGENVSAPAVNAAARAHTMQPANLAGVILPLPGGRFVATAFGVRGDNASGVAGSIQPGIAIWDRNTGELLADRQVNIPPNGNYSTATSDAIHDSPSLVETARGGLMIPYGAASTYYAFNPPSAWSCLRREFCQPFKFVQHPSGISLADEAAQSPEFHLPSIGLSEISSVTLGDTTIVAGQQQPNSPNGQGGAQGYVTFHAHANGGVFDTADGPWDFHSSNVTPSDGLEMLTLAPNDDAYFDFGVLSDRAGAATFGLSIGASRCNFTFPATGSPSADAQQLAIRINESCPALRARFNAIVVNYDPALRGADAVLAPAAVGIVSRRQPVAQLGSISTVSLSCSGSIACGTQRGANTVSDVRTSGLHRHFLYGGVLRSGPYVFYLMDVQELTGSWYGAAGSSYALALACFRSEAPAGAVWTWSDCSGRHSFQVSPGVRAPDRLSGASPYLLPLPASGAENGMRPYIDDVSMAAQLRVKAGYPVISAETAAVLPDGTLLIAHGCQTGPTQTTVCAITYNMKTGKTTSAAAIDRPPGGGSLSSVALRVSNQGTVELGVLAGLGDRWGCPGVGACAMVYRYDSLAGRWSRISAQMLGGSENSGFAGTVTGDSTGFIFNVHVLIGGRAQLHVLDVR